MMLPCVMIACSMTMAVPSPPASPQQTPRIVLVDDTSELEAALASRAPRKDLPVRLTAVSLPGDTAAAVRVLVVAEIDDRPDASGLASVAYSISDERGQQRAHALRRVELRRLPSGALAFLELVSVAPGTYRLKVASLRNSRVGTAEAAVTARVQAAASIRFGDPLIGDTPGDDIVANILPGRRVRGDRLVVSLPIGVEQVIPPDVAIAVDVVKQQSDAAVISAAAPVLAGDGRTRVAQAVVDARMLPSGDYQARVIVSVGGKEAARVFAPFSLERAAAAGAGAPGLRRGVPAGAGAPASGFRPDDVLDPAVLGPFLDELASRAPDGSRAAIAQAKAGRFAEAAATAAAAGRGNPNDPVHPFLLGLSLFSQKQLQDASEAFRDTLRAAPDFFVGAFYIGACYAAGGRDPQAINAWQTSLVGLEPYPVVFRLLGEAMLRAGQPDRAMETLDEAATKWPDDRDIRLRLVKAALDARRYDRVLELTDASLSRTPADPDLLFAGMQAIFERVTQGTAAQADDSLARMKRYRDAYVAAGGPRQSLVAEWVAALEKKFPPASKPA
jgi:tetratricopeptide (TPR) repeat protein